MGEVLPLPHRGDIFLDPRGEGRSLRVSGHRNAATVVLSIWREGECRATFRLAGSEVDDLVRALLAAAPPAAPGTSLAAEDFEVVELSQDLVDTVPQDLVDTVPLGAPSAPAVPAEVLLDCGSVVVDLTTNHTVDVVQGATAATDSDSDEDDLPHSTRTRRPSGDTDPDGRAVG